MRFYSPWLFTINLALYDRSRYLTATSDSSLAYASPLAVPDTTSVLTVRDNIPADNMGSDPHSTTQYVPLMVETHCTTLRQLVRVDCLLQIDVQLRDRLLRRRIY